VRQPWQTQLQLHSQHVPLRQQAHLRTLLRLFLLQIDAVLLHEKERSSAVVAACSTQFGALTVPWKKTKTKTKTETFFKLLAKFLGCLLLSLLPRSLVMTSLDSHRATPEPPTYYFDKGLRKVKPYDYVFSTHAKQRWYGRTILEVFCTEFRQASSHKRPR
jgi:hypothetical protein